MRWCRGGFETRPYRCWFRSDKAILPRRFYERDAVRLARALLGMILVRDGEEGATVGRIVEVEAYCGPRDRAAHSSGGRRTPRNETMYGPPGHLYVYYVYGMHHCCNVVAARPDVPEAVLLRAVEPIAGLEIMRHRRGHGVRDEDLARGPANLCRAFGIDRQLNGADICCGPVWIERGAPVRRFGCSARIGVEYAGPWARKPWRFFVPESPAVSGHVRRGRARR